METSEKKILLMAERTRFNTNQIYTCNFFYLSLKKRLVIDLEDSFAYLPNRIQHIRLIPNSRPQCRNLISCHSTPDLSRPRKPCFTSKPTGRAKSAIRALLGSSTRPYTPNAVSQVAAVKVMVRPTAASPTASTASPTADTTSRKDMTKSRIISFFTVASILSLE